MPLPPGLSPKDADQVLRAVMDDDTNRLRVDAEITAIVTDVQIRAASGDNIAITNQDGTNPLVIEADGSINTNTTIVGGELAIEISAADGDNLAIASQDGSNFMEVNPDGSINVTDNGGSLTVDQGTTPWVISGSVVTSPDVNIHDSAGNSLTSTGTSLDVNVTNTVPASQSGAWSVDVNNGPGVAAVNIQDGGNSITVDGTVTANIGTTGGLALDATVDETHGSATGGTAALQSDLVGGIYNATPPTLTNGQQASLQLDTNGNLKTTAIVTIPGTVSVTQGTTPWVENVAQFGGNNVVTGTGASGAGIPRVTVSNDSNVLVTQSVPAIVANAWPIKVTDGVDTSGVTTAGDQKVVDGLRDGGVFGALNLPTANTPVEAKVGISRLTNRKALIITIQNNGMFWGLSNAVTTATGQPTSNGQILTFEIDPDSTFQVWLVGNANNKNAVITEIP